MTAKICHIERVSVDCHEFANANSRNDGSGILAYNGSGGIDCHAWHKSRSQ